MILLSTILTISKRRLEKNSFDILPGSGIEISGCPLASTYRYILFRLSGKLTSKRASWNYAKLAPRHVLSKTVCQPLQIRHTLCCFFLFINLSEMSIQRWRAGIILTYKKILDVNLNKCRGPLVLYRSPECWGYVELEVESSSLLHHSIYLWFICFTWWSIDELENLHADRTTICFEP